MPDAVLDFDDARDLCQMAVDLKRAIPTDKWVDDQVAGAGLTAIDLLL